MMFSNLNIYMIYFLIDLIIAVVAHGSVFLGVDGIGISFDADIYKVRI